MSLKSGESRGQHNKRIRQEALREQLKAQGHIQHLVDNTNKLQDLDVGLDSNEVQRLRAANDTHKYVINKYIPDLKSVEIVDEDGNNALPKSIIINVVDPRNIDS